MKVKYALILIFSILTVLLAVYSFRGKKKILVKREYIELGDNILAFEEYENDSNFKMHILNRDRFGCVLYAEKKSKDMSHYEYENLFSNHESSGNQYTYDIVANSDLKFMRGDTLYFYNRFGLYEQFKGEGILLNPENVSVYDAIGLDNGDILCLGEIEGDNGLYTTCFFELSRANKKVVITHVLNQCFNSKRANDLLVFAGKFQQLNGCLSYVYERQGEILFFESNKGLYMHSLYTVDETKPPATINFGNQAVFERGKSNLTNIGVVEYDSTYYVISNFPRIDGKILFDVYEYHKYKNSLCVVMDDVSSYDIRFVYQKDENIYLATKRKMYNLKKEQLLQISK